jgi:hypothetical protein
MTISEIAQKINGKVVCCEEKVTNEVEFAFSSDLMSGW